MVSPVGRIDVSIVEEAVPALEREQPGVGRPIATLQTAPDGRWVPGSVRRATGEHRDQLADLQSALSAALTFGEIGGSLLGEDPRRYFIAIPSSNEARGTGGFLSNSAIISARDGKVTIDRVGSNTDPPNLKRLPASVDRQYRKRYGDMPLQRGTMPVPAPAPRRRDLAQVLAATHRTAHGRGDRSGHDRAERHRRGLR